MRTTALIRQLKTRGWCRIPKVLPESALPGWRHGLYGVVGGCGLIAPTYVHNASWEKRTEEIMGATLLPGRLDDLILEYSFYIRPGVINDNPIFSPFLADPEVRQLIHTYLGAKARAISTDLLVHEPGTERGAWRCCRPFNGHLNPHEPTPYSSSLPVLSLHLLLAPFTRETGGILAVPGSHRRPTNPSYEPRSRRFRAEPDQGVLEGQTGDVLALDGRLWHAVAPNPSDLMRLSVVVDLTGGSRRAFPTTALSAAVFGGLPKEVQPLFREWVGCPPKKLHPA